MDLLSLLQDPGQTSGRHSDPADNLIKLPPSSRRGRRIPILHAFGRLLVNREFSLVICCLTTVGALLAAAADIIISTNGSNTSASSGDFIFSPQTLIVSCGIILMVNTIP